MIDAWLLFTLLIPFAEVLLHTRIEQLRQKLEQMNDINNAWGKDKDQMTCRKNTTNKKLRYVHIAKSIIIYYIFSKIWFHFRILKRIANYGLPAAALFFLCVFCAMGAVFIYHWIINLKSCSLASIFIDGLSSMLTLFPLFLWLKDQRSEINESINSKKLNITFTHSTCLYKIGNKKASIVKSRHLKSKI